MTSAAAESYPVSEQAARILADCPRESVSRLAAAELRDFLATAPIMPAACQEHPDTYVLWRVATHYPFDDAVVDSAHNDLVKAHAEGVNLVAYRYARMDELDPDRIASADARFCVDALVSQTAAVWQANPSMFGSGSLDHVRRYLTGEFDAWSSETVARYRHNVEYATAAGCNLPFQTYAYVCARLGRQLESPESP